MGKLIFAAGMSVVSIIFLVLSVGALVAYALDPESLGFLLAVTIVLQVLILVANVLFARSVMPEVMEWIEEKAGD